MMRTVFLTRIWIDENTVVNIEAGVAWDSILP